MECFDGVSLVDEDHLSRFGNLLGLRDGHARCGVVHKRLVLLRVEHSDGRPSKVDFGLIFHLKTPSVVDAIILTKFLTKTQNIFNIPTVHVVFEKSVEIFGVSAREVLGGQGNILCPRKGGFGGVVGVRGAVLGVL